MKHIDYVKTLRLKQVGIALAGLWVIVLIAAISATIYREIDGLAVRSTLTENENLASINSTLNHDLDSARTTIDELTIELQDLRSDYTGLQRLFESYLSSLPLN